MIEFLLKFLLVVIILVILIPLIMLLVGEGALAHKLLEWSSSDDNDHVEMVDTKNNENVIVSTDTTYYEDGVYVSQSITITE